VYYSKQVRRSCKPRETASLSAPTVYRMRACSVGAEVSLEPLDRQQKENLRGDQICRRVWLSGIITDFVVQMLCSGDG
jgi:hypothetical protein